MSHILDNMIWNAITTGNKNIATVDAGVGVYLSDVAPFAGMEQMDKVHMNRLYDLIPTERRIAIHYMDNNPLDPDKWRVLQKMDCVQIVYEYPIENFKTKNSDLIVRLNDAHIPQMLELTALTKPGPFLQRTIDFGNYYGIFIDGRLAAMTGQRMHPLPYMEVSAVCTHPDFRGRGYAKALMLHVMQIILDNSYIPFLHALSSNVNAIQLYESIGYRIRTLLGIDIVSKKD